MCKFFDYLLFVTELATGDLQEDITKGRLGDGNILNGKAGLPGNLYHLHQPLVAGIDADEQLAIGANCVFYEGQRVDAA